MSKVAGFPEPFGLPFLDDIRFDVKGYLDRNPDLSFDEEFASAHVLSHGVYEGRHIPFHVGLLQAEAAIDKVEMPMRRKLAFSRQLAVSRLRDVKNWKEYQSLMIKALGYRPALICGDSHTALFARGSLVEASDFLFLPVSCWGASARGLRKPLSRMNYGATILGLLDHFLEACIKSDCPILFQFGQNDLEFIYHFKRAEKATTAFDADDYVSFIEETVEHYAEFLRMVQRLTGDKVDLVVCSILPPTLSDDNLFSNQKTYHDLGWASEVANIEDLLPKLAALEMPNWRERTRFHRLYNEKLSFVCERQGLLFLDSFNLFIGHDGVVDRRFIAGQGGTDHHLDFYSFFTDLASALIAQNLRLKLLTHYNATALAPIAPALSAIVG